MKSAYTFFLIATTSLLGVATLSAQSRGDKVPLGPSAKAFIVSPKTISKPEKMESPTIKPGSADKKFRPKNWISFEIEDVKIDLPSEKARAALGIGKHEKFLDSVVVSFYFLVPNPDKTQKNQLLLNKNITYLNVPLNDSTCFSAYLSPTTLTHLFGSDTARSGDFIMSGFEIKYKNDIIYRNSSKKVAGADDWWNVASPTIIKADDKYPLLNKDETPFAIFWSDRYPSIKKVDSNKLGSTLDTFSSSLLKEEEESAEPTTETTTTTGTTSKGKTPTGKTTRPRTSRTSSTGTTLPTGTPL